MRRSHVEMRSRDLTPPRQCVSDTHDNKNPPPLREWSPFDIHPPHLDHYLVSRRGQLLNLFPSLVCSPLKRRR